MAFRHALVQVDEHSGEEYIFCSPVAVECFEEVSTGPDRGTVSTPLSWAESMKILEGLLQGRDSPRVKTM